MRILQIGFFLAPGGAERFIVDLSNELAKDNEVILMSLKDDGIDPEFRRFYLSDVSERVKYQCLGLGDGISLSKWLKILRAIKRINPDIVHFHGDNMPLWMIFPMALAPRHIKFVQTIHSDVHNGYDGFVYKFMTGFFATRKRIRFAALSNTNHNELRKVYPSTVSRMILNGRAPVVKTREFSSVHDFIQSIKKDDDTLVILHIARCHIVKNQMRLVRAFNKFISNGGNARLIIIGPGFDSPEGLAIQSLACAGIHFLGAKRNPSDYFLSCDGFCLSSDYEGMPITIIESLLTGLPVLSTPVCGAVDVVRNGENGILAKDFSDEAYYSALVEFCDKISSLKIGAEKGSSVAEYTIEKCAEQYMDFYKMTL